MGKKITKRQVSVVGNQEEEEESYDTEDMDLKERLKDFAEGERMVKLYRYPGDLGGRPRFLMSLPKEDFDESTVQEMFGGGRYFGRWKDAKGLYTRQNFEIEGPSKVQTRAQELEAHNEKEEKPLAFLGQKNEQEGEGGNTDTGIGTADILRIMAETRREAREEMRMLLELMRPAPAAPQATEQVFSLVEKIVPLIQGGGSDASGQNPWLYALSQLKDPLMKAVDTIHTAVTRGSNTVTVPSTQPTPQQSVVTRSPIQPQPVVPEPPIVQPEPKEDDMFLDGMKSYLPMLCKAASEGKDTALYADLILDQVPAFLYPKFAGWLGKPGCLDDLAKIDPAIYNQKAWWESLRYMILTAMSEDGDDRSVQSESHQQSPTISTTDSH